jgi:hypothetical protein
MRSTAFAVPNPNSSSQSRRFFQVWLLFGLPRRADHSAYFGPAKFYLSQPFQPSTEANLESRSQIVNARFQCNRPVAMDQKPETQAIESLSFNEWEIKFLSFSPQTIHRCSKTWAFPHGLGIRAVLGADNDPALGSAFDGDANLILPTVIVQQVPAAARDVKCQGLIAIPSRPPASLPRLRTMVVS